MTRKGSKSKAAGKGGQPSVLPANSIRTKRKQHVPNASFPPSKYRNKSKAEVLSVLDAIIAPSNINALAASKKRKIVMARALRKQIAAQLYLTSTMTLKEISEYLKEQYNIVIGVPQLSTDMKNLRTTWMKSALQDTQDAIMQEIAKLNQLELVAQELYMNGRSAAFCNIMLKTAKRRAQLLGLDKAQKIALYDRRTSELSDEELEKVIREQLGRNSATGEDNEE